jgi:homopolymeric O-antigen transport system ATP-binding protein
VTDISIYAQGLSKRYHIGKLQQKQDTLLNQIGASARAYLHQSARLLRSRSTAQAGEDEIIWALENVSFEVKQGEVVGIIGRNGAGKSTLLKILSRITEPTEGFADVYGRVGSLLEVGTGFHPELTGRENIYLNGAILGMRKAEIERKFDEIVEFSGIGKFIDTPVKQYSSGMYVRLAFAVAAHLEPEILMVDEVLAVGDLAFQKKCLGKMGDVTKQGRTVLFVSHNMAAIKSLCNRAIWLSEGKVLTYGDADEVVTNYKNEILGELSDQRDFSPILNKKYGLSLEDVNVAVNQNNDGFDLSIKIVLKSQQRTSRVGVGIIISTVDGFLVSRLLERMTQIQIEEIDGHCCCIIESKNIDRHLAGGEYFLGLRINFPGVTGIIEAANVASFRIPESDLYGHGFDFTLNNNGVVPLILKLKEVTHY